MEKNVEDKAQRNFQPLSEEFLPDKRLRCLLVCPEFRVPAFWNFNEASKLTGASTPESPLGLITVAALLPKQWEFRLIDLNAEQYCEEDFRDWADIVCVGGMQRQEQCIAEIIKMAHKFSKFVVVGGPGPWSEPEKYREADALVLGEGENSIFLWLESWRNGNPRGVFQSDEMPDLAKSPVPRFDLLNINHYSSIGMQITRGCPYACEFCDIITLFGRKPRSKNANQLVSELEEIYRTGFRGNIHICDDNFIANKNLVKTELLPALISWSKSKDFPFEFAAEVSMNLGADEELLQLMGEAQFRIVFIGVETVDSGVLKDVGKTQNTASALEECVKKIHEHGIIVSAGFILGFDTEREGIDQVIVDYVEKSKISLAMINLLSAVPSAALTNRLIKEGRMLSYEKFSKDEGDSDNFVFTNHGLNFVTVRDRNKIILDFIRILETLYSPRKYMDRILRTTFELKFKKQRSLERFEKKRNHRGLKRLTKIMLCDPSTRWLFLRNILKTLRLGSHHLNAIIWLMALYTNFQNDQKKLIESCKRRIEWEKANL